MKSLLALLVAVPLAVAVPATAASLATYDAVRDGLLAVWAELPLGVRDVTLTTGPAEGYGAYAPAPQQAYAPGQTIHVYAEPVGYGWVDNGDGTWSVKLSMDLALRNAKGETIASQSDFLTLDRPSRNKVLETFVDLEVTLRDFAAGDYQMVFTLHDGASGKSAEFSVPVTLATSGAT
jgi:hypothetical protein